MEPITSIHCGQGVFLFTIRTGNPTQNVSFGLARTCSKEKNHLKQTKMPVKDSSQFLFVTILIKWRSVEWVRTEI